MLAFKKNIYRSIDSFDGISGDGPRINPYDFILTSLLTDRDIFIGLSKLTLEEGDERCKIFFPHASRFGSIQILNSISKRLLEGLVQPGVWFKMNAYHLCYLYDSLYGTMEEYSYENETQRRLMFPELDGNPIDLNEFLNEFFTNTAFLMDQDRFNNLHPQEKEIAGFEDPCLFGVINNLIPSNDEILLLKTTPPPYAETGKAKLG